MQARDNTPQSAWRSGVAMVVVLVIGLFAGAGGTYLAIEGKLWRPRGLEGNPAPAEGKADSAHTDHGGPGQEANTAAAPAEEEEETLAVHLTPEQLKLGHVRTVEVNTGPLQKEIYTVGKVDYDEKRLAFVSARIAGRIDRLLVNFTGTVVSKGQPLLEIYSPDLVTAQEEYLLALQTLERLRQSPRPEIIEGAREMVEASKKRLLLWGSTERQIDKLGQQKQTQIHMTIYSPISGVVIEKKALEGKYVAVGEPLYTIADLSTVWVLADVYEYEIPWIKFGQTVEITTPSFPEKPFSGRVTFINPVLEEKTRTVKVRADVPNRDLKLKPGMFVNVKLSAPTTQAVLTVPAPAILDAGIRKFVWVDVGHSRYERRALKLGPEANGRYVVLEGLSAGERVVVGGNFLVDSQAQLSMGGAAGGHGGHGGH
jgi:Cu(I)/Ag(I) efflux system membrane fusion protein